MTSNIPTHYDIFIDPNFEDFTFEGKTVVHLKSSEATNKVVLNGADITITSCKFIQQNKALEAKVSYDYAEEEVHVELPEQISGEFKLEFHYSGGIKENLKGLYKTRYKVNGEQHAGAITQFETEDARRMFPCFDEPRMKATYDLQVVVEDNFMAVANTPIKSEKKLDSGRRLVMFETLPKMSTYLVFLGLAEFEFIEDKLNDISLRVITHPGLTQYGNMALDFGKKSLDYSLKYFKAPYPISKLDLLSTPDFAAGAMENWGAISFRENYLLNFPGYTSKIEENRIKNVIAHEIAHQWFGNLVSPSIWKYIWLNESFADFFANKVVDYYHPELKVWDYNQWDSVIDAFVADAFLETVPIELKAQKKTSYNIKSIPIIYNKGGAILRMVESFVGEDLFQKGLQNYMQEFAYNVASSNDLWVALEKASNKPVSELMTGWVLQPGFPLVTATQDGTKLRLSQKRFTFLPSTDKTTWIIPISMLLFVDGQEPVRKEFLLDTTDASFDTGVDFKAFKLNVGNVGFYHVQYPLEVLDLLMSDFKNKLSSIDQYNLAVELFALLMSGSVSLDYYLSFIQKFTTPDSSMAIIAISDNLKSLYMVAEGKIKAKIEQISIKFHETMLENMGFIPQDQEPIGNVEIRNTLLFNASYMNSKKVIDFALEQFSKLKTNKSVPADILGSILSIAAKETNDLDWFLDRYQNSKNEVETLNLGSALGEFRDDKVVEKVLEDVVFTYIPMRNQSQILLHISENPVAIPKLWKFFLANLDNIGKMSDHAQGRAILYIMTSCPDNQTLKDMEKFFKEYNKTNEIAKITTEKAFEAIKIKNQLKAHINE